MTRPTHWMALAAAVGAAGLVARTDSERDLRAGAARAIEARAREGRAGGVRASDLGDRDTHAPPQTRTAAAPTSPTTGAPSPQVALGEKLFVSYNCGDCHGAGGAGAMAPSLQDNRWHYGGTPGEVFRSIAEGRPGGMPTWGAIIPGPEMIALAAYVRSLGEGKDLTTENFTGETVARSGR